MDIRDYINNLVKNSFFWTKIHNVKDVSDPIVKAIKERPELDPNDISEPIVGALDELKDAVDGIEIPSEITVKNFPEFPEFPEQKEIDFTPLISVLKEELGKLEAKEVDTKSVVESVRSVEKRIAEFKFPEKEEKDYSSVLNKILAILETPEEKEDHQDIIKALSPLSRTEDISALVSWLKAIYEKEDEQVPFKFNDDGRLLVSVDRVGGGGGGGTSNLYDTAGTQINPATEEKQDEIIENQTSGTQKTQIADASGEIATITGGKLDVNASIDTTGLATSAKQQTDALTNSELRATPVPVSGTFYQTTQPISASSLPLPDGAATSSYQESQESTLDEVLAAVQAIASARGVAADLRVTLLGGTTAVTGTLTAVTGLTNIGGVPATTHIPSVNNTLAVLSNVNNVS